MEKLWVIIDNSGNGWQYFGKLNDVLVVYSAKHFMDDVVAIVSC